jgi:hypothetical protein
LHAVCFLSLACLRAQGKVVYYVQLFAKLLGLGSALERTANAPTLAQQRAAWDDIYIVKFCLQFPAWLVDFITRFFAILCFNRFVMW